MAEFRGTTIRGNQIIDKSISGKQIGDLQISNNHIKEDANIAETKLDIDWGSHSDEILKSKKLIDYVQLDNILISKNTSEVILTQLFGEPVASSNNNYEGIIMDEPNNLCIIRDTKNGGPLYVKLYDKDDNLQDSKDFEIFGRIFYSNDNFVLKLFTITNDKNSPYVSYVMPEDTTIDIQFARRFNLATVNEMFAANEKFVYGASDVTTCLNMEQISKDIYGPTGTLDRDGEPNLDLCVVGQINNLNNFKNILTSSDGASNIGINNIEGLSNDCFNVQDAIDELSKKINGGSIGGVISGQEVVEARGEFDTLNDRLSVSIRPDGKLVEYAKLHEHKKYTFTIVEPVTELYIPDGEKYNLSLNSENSVNGMSFYVNGILQTNGIDFEEIIDEDDITKGNGIRLINDEEIVIGDVITFEWIENNN